MWIAETGSRLRMFWRHEDSVLSAVFLLDNTSIVTTTEDQTLEAWNTETGK